MVNQGNPDMLETHANPPPILLQTEQFAFFEYNKVDLTTIKNGNYDG
jgi:hypothetical protein